MRSFNTATALTLATLAVACSKEDSATSGAPAPSAVAASAATPASSAEVAMTASSAPVPAAPKAGPAGPLNVMLLSIDSLRQDMPWAGYPRAIAPNLTKLAAESVVYSHAYSVSSYTAKSVAAFLTSRYPSTLYRSGYFFTDYPTSNVFLAEILHDHGVHTIGVQGHLYFGRGKHLDQGFDVWELVPGITFDATTDKNITSDKMTDIAIKALSDPATANKPFFTWVHYTDPHDEYNKHPESPDFGKDNRSRYDSEVFFTDLHVGRLLDFARKQPWWNKTAVIITADHGEAFGEHGMYKHAFRLWEVLTRVPLIIHVPDAAPHEIHENRSQIDLAPTIADLEGIHERPESFVGRSLVPELYDGSHADDRNPVVLDLPEDANNPQTRAIVQGNSKLIVYGKNRYELYDLAADPGELHDLSKSEPAKLADMKSEFDKTWAQIPFVQSYGGMKLHDGSMADGPMGPAKK
ncbi:MAG TPA: sulfatase [Polyangiaceae bacterium]|jgi:arylsulfatase A-like enzyme|nr:sulfatase [Polyangiaceae bacterium]